MLHLRARWYLAETGTFLSRDPVESEPPYLYVGANPVNRIDPSGFAPNCESSKCKLELASSRTLDSAGVGLDFIPGYNSTGHLILVHHDQAGFKRVIDMAPSKIDVPWEERIKKGNLKDTGIFKGYNPIWHPYETDAGHLIVRYNEDQATIDINLANAGVMRTTIAEGREICDKWECLRNALNQIQTNRIGYYMLGPNSNSAVYSALRFCKLQSEGGQGIMHFEINGRAHPGADLYLLGWVSNLRSYFID